MTEGTLTAAAESIRQNPAAEGPGLSELARSAAELLQRVIRNTDAERLDFKDIKQLTGALKDLAELMGAEEQEDDEGGIIIRIEGDPGL